MQRGIRMSTNAENCLICSPIQNAYERLSRSKMVQKKQKNLDYIIRSIKIIHKFGYFLRDVLRKRSH